MPRYDEATELRIAHEQADEYSKAQRKAKRSGGKPPPKGTKGARMKASPASAKKAKVDTLVKPKKPPKKKKAS